MGTIALAFGGKPGGVPAETLVDPVERGHQGVGLRVFAGEQIRLGAVFVVETLEHHAALGVDAALHEQPFGHLGGKAGDDAAVIGGWVDLARARP